MMETLTPIDEEPAEDLDDMPITMIPKIVKTAPSPSSDQSPSAMASSPGGEKKEINQIESVL